MEKLYVRKVLEGDESQFSYFIETYKDMAFSIAFRIVDNIEDAEEVVQDSFFKAFRSLGDFRQDSKFSTWFYKIVVNCSLSKTKKRKLKIADVDPIKSSSMAMELVEEEYRNLGSAEQKRIINYALERLNEEDRVILTLYYLNENTIDEVSEICGIKAENVKMKLHRARKKMYTLLNSSMQTKTKDKM